ncbi:erythromycin resistance leader peptide [Staphylococcus equorum]
MGIFSICVTKSVHYQPGQNNWL